MYWDSSLPKNLASVESSLSKTMRPCPNFFVPGRRILRPRDPCAYILKKINKNNQSNTRVLMSSNMLHPQSIKSEIILVTSVFYCQKTSVYSTYGYMGLEVLFVLLATCLYEESQGKKQILVCLMFHKLPNC